VLGKSEESLEKYLKAMKGRTKTRLAFMDLSETYRAIVRKYFPHAEIVADRFHVIRLINRHFRKAYLRIEPDLLKTKGIRNLLRYHEWNLKEEDRNKLQKFLNHHPALKALYDYKQKICQLLTRKNQTAKQCRKLIPKFINIITDLESSPIKILKTLGSTLRNWQNEIARIWRYSKTNSITEGLHTKMEMISRRSFGFKKFENYRLRVKVLCG
jgi:transposase